MNRERAEETGTALCVLFVFGAFLYSVWTMMQIVRP